MALRMMVILISLPAISTAHVSPFRSTHIEDRLQSESISHTTNLSTFFKKQGRDISATHPIKIITLKSGIKGVFKTGEYHYAEVAAYRLSKILGLGLVPPTVFRSIKEVQGSLQLYIDSLDVSFHSDHQHLFKKVDKKSVSDMKLFYYVAGQWDTHYGNQIITKNDGRSILWLIDNSGMLHRSHSKYGGETFIEKGENYNRPTAMGHTFPFKTAITVEGNYSELLPIFSPYLSEAHIKALSKKQSLTYVLWNHTLWLKRDPQDHKRVSRFTNYYYESTLEALKCLTKEDLQKVWEEYRSLEPEHADELIQLILQRRDEVLIASQSGTILRD